MSGKSVVKAQKLIVSSNKQKSCVVQNKLNIVNVFKTIKLWKTLITQQKTRM